MADAGYYVGGLIYSNLSEFREVLSYWFWMCFFGELVLVGRWLLWVWRRDGVQEKPDRSFNECLRFEPMVYLQSADSLASPQFTNR